VYAVVLVVNVEAHCIKTFFFFYVIFLIICFIYKEDYFQLDFA